MQITEEFISSGSGGVKLDPGTYPCKLVGADMYLGTKFQSEETQPNITLIWDSGYTYEDDDGNDRPVYIYDSFLNFKFSPSKHSMKSHLTERIYALGFPNFEPGKNKPEVRHEDFDNLKEFLASLTLRKDGTTALSDFLIDGESLFGREALVQIVHNDKGYVDVVSVTPPVKTAPADKKLRKTEAPVGAPV